MGGIYQWGFVIMSCIYLLSIIVTPPLLHSVPKELNKLSTLLSERAEHFRQTTS
jgi:hypothetical protein